MAKGSSSNSSSTLLRKTSHVVTEIISIVLLALSLELSKSLFSVASGSRGNSGDVTSSIALSEVVNLIELSLRDIVPEIRVLSAE